eukprot:15460445-Alexandrium_andersonii.AAC.1
MCSFLAVCLSACLVCVCTHVSASCLSPRCSHACTVHALVPSTALTPTSQHVSIHAQSTQLLKINCPDHSPSHPRASACRTHRPCPGSK